VRDDGNRRLTHAGVAVNALHGLGDAGGRSRFRCGGAQPVAPGKKHRPIEVCSGEPQNTHYR